MIYGMPECLEQYEIDSAWAIPSIFQIGLANSIVGNNILINVSVTALTSIPENVLRLRTIVVEDAILYTTAPGTNGETDFYQVMRKMLPDADGELLGPMTANQTLNFSYSWPYSTPVDPMELRTLAVIQNENNFSIYQSKMTSTIAQGMNEEMSAIQLELFPNPIADKLTISAVFAQAGTAQVSILNAISQEIIQLSKESVNGSYTRTLDLSELAAGIYYFRMEVDGKVMMKKVVKY